MPTYQYTCEACGHNWEAFQSIKADALTECPNCGEPKAKRLITGGAGFILKGGGWYSDLYASSKGSKGGDSGGSSTTATPGSGASTSSGSASSSSDSSTSSGSSASTSGSSSSGSASSD